MLGSRCIAGGLGYSQEYVVCYDHAVTQRYVSKLPAIKVTKWSSDPKTLRDVGMYVKIKYQNLERIEYYKKFRAQSTTQ